MPKKTGKKTGKTEEITDIVTLRYYKEDGIEKAVRGHYSGDKLLKEVVENA